MSQEARVLLAAEQFHLIGKGRGVNFRLRERSYSMCTGGGVGGWRVSWGGGGGTKQII